MLLSWTLQQLSEASDNARAYQVLAELGAEKGLASRALFVQIGVYFLFPLLMAAAHATCAMLLWFLSSSRLATLM